MDATNTFGHPSSIPCVEVMGLLTPQGQVIIANQTYDIAQGPNGQFLVSGVRMMGKRISNQQIVFQVPQQAVRAGGVIDFNLLGGARIQSPAPTQTTQNSKISPNSNHQIVGKLLPTGQILLNGQTMSIAQKSANEFIVNGKRMLGRRVSNTDIIFAPPLVTTQPQQQPQQQPQPQPQAPQYPQTSPASPQAFQNPNVSLNSAPAQATFDRSQTVGQLMPNGQIRIGSQTMNCQNLGNSTVLLNGQMVRAQVMSTGQVIFLDAIDHLLPQNQPSTTPKKTMTGKLVNGQLLLNGQMLSIAQMGVTEFMVNGQRMTGKLLGNGEILLEVEEHSELPKGDLIGSLTPDNKFIYNGITYEMRNLYDGRVMINGKIMRGEIKGNQVIIHNT